MKKLFLIASLALLPLTAHAQSGGEQVIQAAVDELKPAFCANDLKQAIQIVEGCYAKVDKDINHKNMNQCVIEDIVVIATLDMKGKQYLDNYQVNPYANLDYAKNENFGGRTLKHPNFTSNATQSEDARSAARSARIKVINVLKKDNCFDLDKLK